MTHRQDPIRCYSLAQSRSRSNVNEGVHCILQNSSIIGTLPKDCLVSYPEHPWGGRGFLPRGQFWIKSMFQLLFFLVLNLDCLYSWQLNYKLITYTSGSVGWDCRIHWLHLCRRLRPHSPMSVLNMTLNSLMVRFK